MTQPGRRRGDPASARSGEGAGDLLDLLAGRNRAQAVATAAALGLADHLVDGARDVSDLAASLACDRRALTTLLRFLAGLGLVERVAPGRYALTERGAELRSDRLGPLAAFMGAPEQWDAWSRLTDAVRGGGPPAFERLHGTDLYDYMARNDEAARRYDRAIDAFTRHEAERLCAVFDFADVRTVVDIGGGRGAFLAELLRSCPDVRGVLVDLPHVVARAGPRLNAEFGRRFDSVATDFFGTVPVGGDVYLVKHVLHNWDDARALELLSSCASALRPGGRVLVIEAILMPDGRFDTASILDLEMLVLTGGRERRKPELRRLLARAGLRLQRVERLTPSAWLLVGEKR